MKFCFQSFALVLIQTGFQYSGIYFKITNLIKIIDPLTKNKINNYIYKNKAFSMFFFERISKCLTNLEYIKFKTPINSQEKMINSIKNLEDIIRNQKL